MVIKCDGEMFRKGKDGPTEEHLGTSDFGVLGFLNKPLAGPSTRPRKLEPPAAVIRPPSSRPLTAVQNKANGLMSYTKPVLEYPASKVGPETMASRKVDGANGKGHLHQHTHQCKPPQGEVVKELLNDLHSMDNSSPHQEIIQPSANTTERLSRIIGRPCDRIYSCVDTKYVNERKNRPTTADPKHRRSRRPPYWRSPSASAYDDDDDQTECGGSVATVSDLDNLASKSLRRKMNMRGNRLTMLRKEIKEMVVSLDERDEQEAKKSGKTKSDEKESRYESDNKKVKDANKPDDDDNNIESCTMMWCKGPPTLESFVNDMKQIMMCAAGGEKA